MALTMGISKRELLESYYPGELARVVRHWGALRDPESATEETDALRFFGDGGERVE